ncbi:MAG TPA: 2-hydroxyacyl-CoA dehydratase, partial [bacterium]|nr:2-hydroxyacyl-CoA dehydratase [bacterium]
MSRAVGTVAFTTTIPVEVIIAAGYRPVDLNNVFVSSPDAPLLVERAEMSGFPRSCCAWIKGIFESFRRGRDTLPIDVFVAVTEGDCSNAKVLKELIDLERGVKSYLFPFPQDRSPDAMRSEIEKFAAFLGTTVAAAEKVRHDLRPLRRSLERLDDLSWRHPGLVKGVENHRMLVSASDFNGDPVAFRADV